MWGGMWIVNVLVPQPATTEKQKRWTNAAAWWIFVSGKKSIDAANYQESSNI